MIKKNKWKLLISSIVILLPIVLGLIFWKQLPEQMVTHWGADGEADGWSSRASAVFSLPIFILAVHWICIFFTAKDPKNKDQNNKIFRIVLWICPVTSLVAGCMVYAAALDQAIDQNFLIYGFCGLFFVIIGNYLPKCKQNYTIGIKVKWALENEENWNATHRFCGKVWTIGGFLMMGCFLFPEEISLYVFITLLLVLSGLSIGYSYYYFKTKQGRG